MECHVLLIYLFLLILRLFHVNRHRLLFTLVPDLLREYLTSGCHHLVGRFLLPHLAFLLPLTLHLGAVLACIAGLLRNTCVTEESDWFEFALKHFLRRFQIKHYVPCYSFGGDIGDFSFFGARHYFLAIRQPIITFIALCKFFFALLSLVLYLAQC